MRTEEALILAGGAGRRMLGRDKGRMPFNGQPLVRYAIDVMRAQNLRVTVSCNRSPFYYRALADRIVSDQSAGYPGPLVAMCEALHHISATHCIVSPCDTPYFSAEHLTILQKESRRYPQHWIVAVSDDGVHPLHAIFPMSSYNALKNLVEGGERRMMRAIKQLPHRKVYLPSKAVLNLNYLRSLQA